MTIFFCNFHENRFDLSAGILVSSISDHFPYFLATNVELTNKTPPTFIKITDKSPHAKIKFINTIKTSGVFNLLDKDLKSNPTNNYDILLSIITDAKNKFLAPKIVKYKKHKHKKSEWITQGLVKSIAFRDKLYQQMIKLNPDSPEFTAKKINLGTYNKILKNNIKLAKQSYYKTCFDKNKFNMKKTWGTIKELMTSNKNKLKLDFLEHNGKRHYQKADIAREFNNYFINIGPKLSPNTTSDKYKQYLKTPCNTKFKFSIVSEDDVLKIINECLSKSSCGFDDISLKLIKDIKHEILDSLTLIINQCLSTGIIPNKLKIAKVIPLLKKGDTFKIENYRPVSLLPSISKFLEKVVFNQLSAFFFKKSLIL